MPRGSCWCKKVQYEYNATPVHKVQCHCVTCQKISGSAFTVNVMVPKSAVTITQGEGDLRSYTQQHILGKPLTVYFCGTCSSNVWKNLHTEETEDLWVIQTGTLDGENGELGADVEVPSSEGFLTDRAKWLPQVPGLTYVEPVK